MVELTDSELKLRILIKEMFINNEILIDEINELTKYNDELLSQKNKILDNIYRCNYENLMLTTQLENLNNTNEKLECQINLNPK
jgi:D-ribose pyranose/furanose isomerase RbsD